jgi:hypothetical protein
MNHVVFFFRKGRGQGFFLGVPGNLRELKNPLRVGFCDTLIFSLLCLIPS